LQNLFKTLYLQSNFNRTKIMGVTRLKRKDRRNAAKANKRVADIKRLTAKPVIKNIDVEAIKKSFAEKA
jgi:hypothetical protein